jgi:hypothetical protein
MTSSGKERTELTSSTKMTFDLQTLVMCAGILITLVTGFNVIKTDIAESSRKAEESLTKIEFTISQEAVKQIVRDTSNGIKASHLGGHIDMQGRLQKSNRENTDKIINEIRRTKPD